MTPKAKVNPKAVESFSPEDLSAIRAAIREFTGERIQFTDFSTFRYRWNMEPALPMFALIIDGGLGLLDVK